MANLSTNQIAGNNSNDVNRFIFQKTPKCIKLNYNTVYKNHNQSFNNFSYDDCNTNKFAVLHQNICGISNKTDEFLNSLPLNAPQVICFTEHHLRAEKERNVNLSQLTLGASFCRQT
jgi:hypothetical protein